MPKAFTEDEKKQIRTQLLAEGQRQFAAYGLKKTRVEELCAGAGISKGAFYLFYVSKEELFMEVVEQAEERFRQEVLAAVELPGPTARARLFRILHKAFTLWKTIPVLQIFTHGDYEQIARRMPAEALQDHLLSDQTFVEELIARCRQAGIEIRVTPVQVVQLFYAVFFASLHEDDLGTGRLTLAIEQLLELIAAFCLGEVELQYVTGTIGMRDKPNG